jgi:hypothetical protein
MPDRPLPYLRFDSLHERHYGVTAEVGASLTQAARVCLSRHHVPPTEVDVSDDGGEHNVYAVEWSPPSTRERAAHRNEQEATEDGACCLALSAAEEYLGLVALGRTAHGSGADYYLGRPGTDVNPDDMELDLEATLRLEVSGIDLGGRDEISRRVRSKKLQAGRGRSSLPALVGVVAFKLRQIVLAPAAGG